MFRFLTLSAVALFLSVPLATAQQPPPPSDNPQILQEQLKLMENQMDNYLHQLVRVAAQVQVLTNDNAALQKKLADAEKKPEPKVAAEPPK